MIGCLRAGLRLSLGSGAGWAATSRAAFAENGAHVVLVVVTDSVTCGASAEVEAMGQQVLTATVDMCDVEDCQRLAAAGNERFGRIDSLVNVAYLPSDFTTLNRRMPIWPTGARSSR